MIEPNWTQMSIDMAMVELGTGNSNDYDQKKVERKGPSYFKSCCNKLPIIGFILGLY